MRVLVTGASGFVGSKACPYLTKCGHEVLAFSRSSCNFPSGLDLIKGESLIKTFEQSYLLKGVDCVIHLAGKNNDSSQTKLDPNSSYFNSNVYETIEFAKICSKYSVKRFIFVSSIKVNGESTSGRSPFNENDVPDPKDNYAFSKMEAELELLKISQNSKMEIVIVKHCMN